MKTHRPWQPHIRSSPLFNPFAPIDRTTTLDHCNLMEEEETDETEMPNEEPRDETIDPPPVTKRD